ncbi:MAG: hypothetical protein LBV17_03345 [Treponema sp.]|jgi:hypothetical protein|nr:hypothetical protein [Treponema sp.]
MRKSIILSFYIFFVFQVNAQQSYTINDFGTYIIDCNLGIIKKVPIDQELFFSRFWKDYAVFSCIINRHGTVIYNFKNGFISEILGGVPPTSGEKLIEVSPYIIYFVDCYIFKLDPVNLKIIEKTYVGELYKYPDTDEVELEPVVYEHKNKHSMRYRGKNNFIDITYASQIYPSNCTAVYDSALNRYVVCVYKSDYGR